MDGKTLLFHSMNYFLRPFLVVFTFVLILLCSSTVLAQGIILPSTFDEQSAPFEKRLEFGGSPEEYEFVSTYGLNLNDLPVSGSGLRGSEYAVQKQLEISNAAMDRLLERFPYSSIGNLLDLNTSGFANAAEYEAILNSYHQMGIYDLSFSLGAKVPIDYFLSQLSKYPPNLFDSGERDLFIRASFFRSQYLQLMTKRRIKTKKALSFLASLGITDYIQAAIPGEIAEKMYRLFKKPKTDKKKPLALVIVRKELSESTFSEQRVIPEIAKTHRTIVMGAGSDIELAKAITKVAKKFKKIDALIITSHGLPTGVYLGDQQDYNRRRFDMNDSAVFAVMNKYLRGTTIIFSGCQVGAPTFYGSANQPQNLAEAIIRYAPKIKRVIASVNNSGGLSITYDPSKSQPYRVHFVFSLVTSYVPGIGREEFFPAFTRLYRDYDTNHDGFLDISEFVILSQQFTAHLGALRGDERYDAAFDINDDGAIGNVEVGVVSAIRKYSIPLFESQGIGLDRFQYRYIESSSTSSGEIEFKLQGNSPNSPKKLIVEILPITSTYPQSTYEYDNQRSKTTLEYSSNSETSITTSGLSSILAQSGGASVYYISAAECEAFDVHKIDPNLCGSVQSFYYQP